MGIDCFATSYQGYILDAFHLDYKVREYLGNYVNIVYTQYEEEESMILAINSYCLGLGSAECSETQNITEFLTDWKYKFPDSAQSKLDEILSLIPGGNVFSDKDMTFGIFCETFVKRENY